MGVVDWLNRRFAPWWTALGIAPRTVTLEVRGRKSRRPIRLSVSPAKFGGEEFLVSLAGERQWVRNVRAASGEATVLRWRRIPVRLTEVPVEERAPILVAYVSRRAFTRSAKRAARLYFGLTPPVRVEDMKPLAAKFPVFRIEPRSIA